MYALSLWSPFSNIWNLYHHVKTTKFHTGVVDICIKERINDSFVTFVWIEKPFNVSLALHQKRTRAFRMSPWGGIVRREDKTLHFDGNTAILRRKSRGAMVNEYSMIHSQWRVGYDNPHCSQILLDTISSSVSFSALFLRKAISVAKCALRLNIMSS